MATKARSFGVALPYFRWYPNDHLSDRRVQQMTIDAEGVFRRLLDYQWKKGAIPNDKEQLATICSCSLAKFVRAWKQVEKMFEPMEGTGEALLRSKRLELERTKEDALRIQRSLAGKASADKRNARQRPLNERYIAVAVAEQSSSMDERSLALDDARPLVIDMDAKCEECPSRGPAFAAGVHEPGCSRAPKTLPRVSRVGAE